MRNVDSQIQSILTAFEHPEDNPVLAEVIERSGVYRPCVQRDGKWLLEGFIAGFARDWEVLRACDPTLSPSMPSHLFDVRSVATMFGLDPADIAGQAPVSSPELNELEMQIVEVLAVRSLTGEQIATALDRYYDGHLKGTLSSLRKRGVLGNRRPSGYFVTSKVRTDTFHVCAEPLLRAADDL